MSIAQNLINIKNALPADVTLVAVSKTKSSEEILEAYNAGHRDFGENKIQEMHAKWEVLPRDIRWHMIGHVQRNKVKFIAPYVSLIHGVDSLKLLREIDRRGAQNNRVIPCLLQVHIAQEESKFGFEGEELQNLFHSGALDNLKMVKVSGLMGMATFTEDEQQLRDEFRYLKNLFDRCREQSAKIDVLSMGMSGDYHIAVQEGSTMVRIGSSIFGPRNQE